MTLCIFSIKYVANVAFDSKVLLILLRKIILKESQMPKYLTIPQIARICSVDRSTIHRWAASGKIKSFSTPGGHRRIHLKDLKKFFKENNMPIKLDEVEKRRTRFLVADDDTLVQRQLKKILSGPLIDIETASDGFEAGIKVVSFKPHLVILDLSMPNMNGFEVCKYIKTSPDLKKIKVLIMTSHGTEGNKKKIMSLGADAFLTKPGSKKTVIDLVEKLLKN